MLSSAVLPQEVRIVPAAPPAPQAAVASANARIEALASRLAQLELQRVDMVGQLRSSDAAVRAAAQDHLNVLESQIAESKAEIQQASKTLAAERSQVIIAPDPPRIITDGFYAHDLEVMALFVMAFVILLPIVIGIGRRIARKGAPVSPLPDTISPRLDRMEQAIDAIAIEVERVSESQRFIAKVLAERGVAQVPAEAGVGAGIIEAPRVRGAGHL